MLLIWWFLAPVSPGTVLSNSEALGGNPMSTYPYRKEPGLKPEALGSVMLSDLRGR